MQNIQEEAEFSLYKEYMEELWLYCPEDKREDDVALREGYDELMNTDRVHFHKIYHANQYIGFLVIEELKEKDRENLKTKYYVNEAYIVPEYRKIGLMSSALDQILSQIPSESICLHVIRNNPAAIDFWMSYFRKRQYNYMFLPDYEGYEHCSFYKFYK